MNTAKYRKNNAWAWILYSAMAFLFLIPLWFDYLPYAVSASLILGWFGSMLNSINNQLRIMNGEDLFPDDKKKTIL